MIELIKDILTGLRELPTAIFKLFWYEIPHLIKLITILYIAIIVYIAYLIGRF